MDCLQVGWSGLIRLGTYDGLPGGLSIKLSTCRISEENKRWAYNKLRTRYFFQLSLMNCQVGYRSSLAHTASQKTEVLGLQLVTLKLKP
jgi:hypothetical protein